MKSKRHDRAFARFCRQGDPQALARVFDGVAPDLHRVARHLAGDAHAADDLVQATFLAAIEHRSTFSPGDPVFPWLLAILANRARRLRRSRARQPDPDRVTAPSDAPDPADVAQRGELSRSLQSAIVALPEPYGSLLNMHLRHGLSANEIALQLGRPPGSVRKQISRGMERLRQSLPPTLAGGAVVCLGTSAPALGAIRATVVEAARRAAPAGAAATGAVGAGSGVAALVAVGLTAIALAGATAWFAGGERATSVARADRIHETVAERATARAVSSADEQPVVDAAMRHRVVASERPFALAVVVTDATTGEPVESFQARVQPVEPPAVIDSSPDFADMPPSGRPFRPGTHHEGGRRVLHDLEPGEYLVEVHPLAPGLLRSEVHTVEVTESGGAELAIRLRSAAQRTLRVVDAAGHPLAGTEVELIAAKPGITIGLATGATPFVSHPTEDPAVELLLEGETSVDGTLALRGPREPLVLRLRGANHAPRVVTDVDLGVHGVLEVRVATGAKLHGRVDRMDEFAGLLADEGGDGMDWIRQSRHAPRIELVDVVSGMHAPVFGSDDLALDGTFSIEHVPPGEYHVRLTWGMRQPDVSSKSDRGHLRLDTVVLQEGRDHELIADVPEIRPVEVAGTVTVDGASPPSGSTIRWHAPPDERWSAPPVESPVGADGGYRTRLVPGSWNACLVMPLRPDASHPVTRLNGPVLELATDTAGAHLAFASASLVVVARHADGRPAAHAEFELRSEDIGWPMYARADARGVLRLPRAPRTRLVIFAEGSDRLREPLAEVDLRNARSVGPVEVELPEAGALRSTEPR